MNWKLKMDVAGLPNKHEWLRVALLSFEQEYQQPFTMVHYERDTDGEVIAFWVA